MTLELDPVLAGFGVNGALLRRYTLSPRGEESLAKDA
jgi:hypothetical protein